MAFSSDRGGQGAVRGVAEFNNVNGASVLEGMEGREGNRWVGRLKSRAKGGKQRMRQAMNDQNFGAESREGIQVNIREYPRWDTSG